MEWDIKRVYTALDADEVKIGSKVILASDLATLKCYVRDRANLTELQKVHREDNMARFEADGIKYTLCYLVEEPGEKKLKWTDLKIKDVIKRGKEQAEVTYINEKGFAENNDCHICIGCLGIMTDIELEEWEKVENK